MRGDGDDDDGTKHERQRGVVQKLYQDQTVILHSILHSPSASFAGSISISTDSFKSWVIVRFLLHSLHSLLSVDFEEKMNQHGKYLVPYVMEGKWLIIIILIIMNHGQE